ncbi:MAG: DUF5522 domain-containing protein [Methylococcaceae bacterium]
MNSVRNSCPLCGNLFSCSSVNTCWCMNYPAIISIDDNQTECFCETCLSKIIQEKIIQTLNSLNLQESISVAKNYQNYEKLIEGIDYFVEQGSYVFTKWYHLKRGICCQNGCRHCPYSRV